MNPPIFLEQVYPGQKLALAVLADGSDRESLLRDLRLQVTSSSPSQGQRSGSDLRPAAVRQLKAQGADMALQVLKVAGFSADKRSELESSTSVVSMAVFLPEWAAPTSEVAEEIRISATCVVKGETITLPPLVLKLRPTAAWLQDAPLTQEQFGRFLCCYHEDPAPGFLLTLFCKASDSGDLQNPSALAYFAVLFRENAGVREAALRSYPSLDAKTQKALVYIFQAGGQNVRQLWPSIPAENLSWLPTVEVLKDPRLLPRFSDPVALNEVKGVGGIMDQCWAAWMATGDKSYLRALVGLLENGQDYAAFEKWKAARLGMKGFNAHVAKGMTYQIAGWSIGSFQRSDTHVADWLAFWENDSTVPALIRKEIAGLPGNPAFVRK